MNFLKKNKNVVIGIVLVILLISIIIIVKRCMNKEKEEYGYHSTKHSCPDDKIHRLSSRKGYNELLGDGDMLYVLDNNNERKTLTFKNGMLHVDGENNGGYEPFGPTFAKAVEFGIRYTLYPHYANLYHYKVGFFDANGSLIEKYGFFSKRISGLFGEVYVCFQIEKEGDKLVLKPSAHATSANGAIAIPIV